jgi:F420-dependent oxidoreductase-like protein
MKIGVMLEGQEGLTWERWFRIADRVESLGLDSLWRSDHFFSLMGDPQRPALECWTSLTALAERTQRIRFGPLVSPMTFRHPALLARMAAAVDLLSGGRLVLGVGAGWNVAEHEAFGIGLPPLKERFDRFEEGIAVIKALWTGGPVDLDGRYYPLRGAAAYPRPLQRPAPPLLIGGDGEVRLLRIVAREADEWNSHAPGPDVYRVKRAKLEEHCRAVGRDPAAIRRSWMGGIVIGRDQGEVAEKGRWMRSFLSALSSVPADRALDELRRRAWIVGTPDQARSQLEAWSALGIERVMFQWYNLDDLDGLALLAQLQGAPEAQSPGKRGRDDSSV